MVHRKSKVIIKTVVIGKKLIAVTLVLLLLAVFLFTSFLTVQKNFSQNKLSFHMHNVSRAIPVVGVNYKDESFKKNLYRFTGVYPGENLYNFSVLPCFFESDRTNEYASLPVYYDDGVAKPVAAGVGKIKIDEVNNSSSKIELKNETTYNIDINSLLNLSLDLKPEADKPFILIVHTHGTESYTPEGSNSTNSARSEDKNINVVKVGEEMKKELEAYGYNVIHDTTLNDNPSYNNSYSKTLSLIESYLKKYPSIKCVFDIHRDAIEKEDGTRVKFTTKIGNEKVSQVMIVCGSDGLGLSHPKWQNNLSFALKVQNYLNNEYPGFMRPINLRRERFNMHKTNGSLLFEIGTHGNTLEEAIGACKYLAEGIHSVLK